MNEISSTDAKKIHGISTFHNNLPNGENRFRLKKFDGTGYIRTESNNQGAWQESHFHNYAMETYIVQKHWIAYAEELNGEIRVSIYKEGDIFTTKHGIVHNIFMPKNAVIHTVKHGKCYVDDRNTEGTENFNKLCILLDNEEKIIKAANENKNLISENKITYGEEYRHFDNLVWQAPAWAAAIFALAIGSLGSENLGRFSKTSNITINSIEIVFLTIVSLTLYCFSLVMFRFRTHQQGLKRYKATPFAFSASSLTQLIINIQATFLSALTLAIAGVPVKILWILAPLFIVLITWRGHTYLNSHRHLET